MSTNGDYRAWDLLLTSVILLDANLKVIHVNLAAESLLSVSCKSVRGAAIEHVLARAEGLTGLIDALHNQAYRQQRLHLSMHRHRDETLVIDVAMQLLDDPTSAYATLEFREIDQQLRLDREERLLDQSTATKELVRNLAHEIKNPLGGIRGAAQLLAAELPNPGLREYTDVIVKESGRLQNLVDRLLAPHRSQQIREHVNIHEITEYVRRLVLSEYRDDLHIVRDYDTSIPDLHADKEQMIQAVLNIVQNAAQALQGCGRITIRTRVVRQITLAKRRHRLALDLHIIDDGPGISDAMKERIFFPLVTGRPDGTGLGLTLAQSFVQQHGGTIECESVPGRTVFRLLLPLQDA